MPVQYLKGVGPARAAKLARLGIANVEELYSYFPRAWEDRRETKSWDIPPVNGKVVFKGRVLSARLISTRGPLAVFKAVLESSGRILEAVWFKRRSPRYDVFQKIKREAVPGAWLWVVGKVELALWKGKEVHAEEAYPVGSPQASLHVNRLVSLYPLTEGLDSGFIREILFEAFKKHGASLWENLPSGLVSKRELLSKPQALFGIHFPRSQAELQAARSRLAYEELLCLEIALALKRQQYKKVLKGFSYEISRNLLTPFRKNLGFEFTKAQTRVVSEIFSDMQSPHPMARLLQGDVGSGKTVVALSALLLAVENGRQGALMAPTEILAEQHYSTLKRFLRGLPVEAALLTSKWTKKQREKELSRIRSGRAQIVVGTHALLEKDVELPNLSLVVVDEQHRFGVRQRAVLRRKAASPDLLVMTATPIPRTLALTLYGDLDVSVLDELPPGRTPVVTEHVEEREAFSRLREQVALGRQAYVVYPLVEESDKLELKAAKKEMERLQREVFPDLKVELLHGQMPPSKKDRIMEDFSSGAYDVLVATSVVEVGVDVANAAVMVIQHAERFGLATLHQLRGRVGRGSVVSFCFVVGEPRTEEARRRLQTLCSTHDGFKISEEDLRLRGPGEVLGLEQHGPLELKVADILKDKEILSWAQQDSRELLGQDPRLARPENSSLRKTLIERYQARWRFIELA